MNKYLQMLKSEKCQPIEGSKGSEDASEPFEPTSGDRSSENARALNDPSARRPRTSGPFEPMLGERARQFTVGESSGCRALERVAKFQMRSSANGSKGSKAASEPFEPMPDSFVGECGEFAGLPFEDGPYFPWGPYLTPARLKEWQCDLLAVVDELAELERWPDDVYDIIVQTIERQPISTLRPDIAYFRGRLYQARAVITAVRLR